MLQHKFNRKAEDDVASAKRRGLMSAADKASHDAVGSVLSALRSANLAIIAATVTTLVSVTLSEGTWLVQGWADITMGAAAGSADIYLTAGQGGSATITNAANLDGSGITAPVIVVVPPLGTQVVSLNCYASVACTASWLGGPGGLGTAVGMRGMRLK